MKLFVGKRLKCIKSFGDYEKGEKFTIESIEKNGKYNIGGDPLDINTVELNFKGLKTKAPVEEEKKKRVLFPWMKDVNGQRYKTMLALLADKKGWSKVISGEISYNKRLLNIVEKTNKMFPNMYTIVSKFYAQKGRSISEKEFQPIAMGRISMMFRFDRDKKEVLQMPEHPRKCAGKLDDAIKWCEELLNKEK